MILSVIPVFLLLLLLHLLKNQELLALLLYLLMRQVLIIYKKKIKNTNQAFFSWIKYCAAIYPTGTPDVSLM